MSRSINLIVIHCSATPSGKSLASGGQSAAQRIDALHQARGFARTPTAVRAFSTGLPHIGYHYVVDTNGIALNGRAGPEVGAHARGHNHDSLGICLVGGFEKTGRYTAAQWGTLALLVRGLCQQYSVPLQPAVYMRSAMALGRGVCGHRDLSADLNADGAITEGEWLKTCPGFSVSEWLARGLVPLAKHIYPNTL